MISSIRHTGIVVRDLSKSVEFYKKLGFTDHEKAIEEGEFIDQVTGFTNVKLEWVKLKAQDGSLLELLKYHSHPLNEKISNQDSNQLGCSHVAFTVEDIDKACTVIQNEGGSIVNPPALSKDNKVKVSYCHDLEGVLMEIVEVL